MLSTLVTLRAGLEDFPTLAIGIINAAYFLGLYLGANYCDHFVARAGHGRAYAVFASLGAVGALLHAIAIDQISWVFIRLATGFCVAGLMMITESWLNASATRTNRGQVMSMYMITHFIASGSGQLLIPLGDPSGYQLFSIAAIGYCLALVPVSLTRIAVPEFKGREKFKFRQVYSYSQTAISGSFSAGLVSGALYGLGPVYTQGIGMSTTTTALFMALIIFSGVILQWPIGKLSDRMDRRKLMVVLCLISAAVAIVVMFSANWNIIIFLSFVGLYGTFSFTIYPVALAYMNDSAPEGKLLYAAAGMLTAYSVGAVISPIIAATGMDLFGVEALFPYIALIYFVTATVVFIRTRARPAPKRKIYKRFFRVRKSSPSNLRGPKLRDEMDKDIARLAGGSRRKNN